MNQLEQDLAWLRGNKADIWKENWDSRTRRAWFQEKRRLTPEEWKRVQEIIDRSEDGLICVLHNACMGFGCGITLYETPPHVFPGATPKPELVTTITKDHLPIPKRKKKDPHFGYDDRTFFEDGWVAFSPFTHSKANAKLLVEHGFDAPKDKGHYDY